MKLSMGILVVACVGLSACDHVAPLPAGTFDAGVKIGWTVIPAGSANLNAVSGLNDDAVLAVGDRGTIWLWDGKTLTPETSGTTANLRGVFALDANDAYAVGDGGTILHRTGGGWQQVGAGITRQVLTAVWADSTRVVAVGSAATVILGTATGYQLLPVGTPAMPITENLFAVTGTPGGVVNAVGALGLLLQLNGMSLSRVAIPAFSKVLSGASTGPSGAYFVGQQGTVYNYNGGGLTAISGCPQTALRAVATADTTAWIVGWDGTICGITSAGSKINSYPYTDARWFNGVYAASATSLYVVGASGTMLHGFPDDPSDASAPGVVP